MDKIEKVKEWVKKQKKETLARNSIGVITGKALFVDANELLSFLDTLSEEPDKSLEEAAEISFDEAKSLTEDYRDFLAKGLTENQPRPIGPHWFCEYAKKRFIAGAEWQAEQMPMPEDTVLFQKGVAEGRRLEREDMMKVKVKSDCT